jgi:hypothetical protein
VLIFSFKRKCHTNELTPFIICGALEGLNRKIENYTTNHIGGVMVTMFASSAVDFGFEPRSDQTKDYKIGICCFSAKRAALRCIPSSFL